MVTSNEMDYIIDVPKYNLSLILGFYGYLYLVYL